MGWRISDALFRDEDRAGRGGGGGCLFSLSLCGRRIVWQGNVGKILDTAFAVAGYSRVERGRK